MDEYLDPFRFRRIRWVGLLILGLGLSLGRTQVVGQIPQPDDAPPPLRPEASAAQVQLPAGFRLELLAAEPLVREPSGVCWDEQGRLFVCELHGYNLEGQFDIEALNETGELDRVVRRVQADDQAKKAALAGTNGCVKLLLDTDRDGRLDRAEVWADDLPPCYGLCPSRGGLIVACAPDIVYLADRDGDGRVDLRETLFTGFETGALERGVNCPQAGPDGWIYFGRGHGGGQIRGPYLSAPVQLPRTDFRIRPDGSAIEPLPGGTHTFGFTMTDRGERIVISTRTPGIVVAPIAWSDLRRNPHASLPSLEYDGAHDVRVYPISQPHPWRSRRAQDPGFSKYYADRYGIEEAAPNGYFTSACSPLFYRDSVLPGLQGQLLACEPAQNLIHRARIVRQGLVASWQRLPEEQSREFLASSDVWFHPMALSHMPDGSIAIVDFYREIIEDYSAIPRYLQQEYGLIGGQDRGRIWRLTHDAAPSAPNRWMSQLSATDLIDELSSSYFWRRETARRLLREREDSRGLLRLAKTLTPDSSPELVLAALDLLDGSGQLEASGLARLLQHPAAPVRADVLRRSAAWLDRDATLRERAFGCLDDPDPFVQLHLALALGATRDPRAVAALAQLAQRAPDNAWMQAAILTSATDRAGRLFAELTRAVSPEGNSSDLAGLVERLCQAIASARDDDELSLVLHHLGLLESSSLRLAALRGLQAGFPTATAVTLDEPAQAALGKLSVSPDADVARIAAALRISLRQETPEQRRQRMERLVEQLVDVLLPESTRLAAVAELADETDADLVEIWIEALPQATPRVRAAILSALFARRDRLPLVAHAVLQQRISPASLNSVQQDALRSLPDPALRAPIHDLLAADATADRDKLQRYLLALGEPRDVQRGAILFREKCATCHPAHGQGMAVGPDLTAEFRRAEETLVRDVLLPSATISAGYEAYVIETKDGRNLSGVLAFESANDVNLRLPDGKQVGVLRKDVESIRALEISLMPADLSQSLTPNDLADLIAWLRRPPELQVLFDEDPSFLQSLNEGTGVATLDDRSPHHGSVALRISPPQRYAARIENWNFPIREHPGPGEFRYLRFAWRAEGASGVMLELADAGRWPPANEARGRYVAGQNSSAWQATTVADEAPADWTVVVRDLWHDFGDCTLTGIAPTALGGDALFDQLELWRATPP